MLKTKESFSSFAVKDLEKAREFYSDVLGMDVENTPMGTLELSVGGGRVMIYPKDDHQPAVYTILNIPVDDIEAAVDELGKKGVTFLQYDLPGIKTDQKGIARDENGPSIAWFTDPSGNIVSVLTIPAS